MPSGFLLDMGISSRVSQVFQKRGWQSIHVHEMGMASASDMEIINIAKNKDFVIITTDKDFSNHLAIGKSSTPSIITLRLDNPSADEQISALERLVTSLSITELDGCLVTLERDKYRKRILPIR